MPPARCQRQVAGITEDTVCQTTGARRA
jgi:hypothetical protein